MTRQDIHRPKNFRPEDYEVIGYIDTKPPRAIAGDLFLGAMAMGATGKEAQELVQREQDAWEQHVKSYFPRYPRTDGQDYTSIHVCHHCGHNPIRWAAVVEHKPTGDHLVFGEICATERVGLEYDAYRFRALRTHAEKLKARLENDARKAAFIEENGDVVDYLVEYEVNHLENGKPYNDFLDSLLSQYRRKGELSERQVAAVRKSIDREARWQRIREEEAATAGPFVAGKGVQIAGTIVSLKWKDGYNGEPTLKMLVKTDDGNKYWGTVPRRLAAIGEDELKDRRIEFKAEATRSDNDEHFGFFKRPRDGRLIRRKH